MQWSAGGIQLIDIDLLGSHPCNRGRLGVSSFHVHRIVDSILTDGFSRHRYRDATVVRVPDQHLEAFRQFNRDLSAMDDRLPPFSPNMKYALLTKDHLVSALKLFRCGTVPMYHSKEVIRPNPADAQLRTHLTEGLARDVMAEGLWLEDFRALQAMITDDNLNASVEMATNEMEVLSFLSSELADMPAGSDAKEQFRLVMARAKSHFGSQAFGETDMVHLYNFAVRVPRSLCRNLSELHFSLVSPASLRCKPQDFGAIAKIDSTSTYSKVALIVSLYLGATGEAGGAARQSVTGVAAVCGSVKKEMLQKMQQDSEMMKTTETFLKTVLKAYKADMTKANVKMMLHSGARLYYRVGRLLQAWPGGVVPLQQALASAEAKYAADMLAAHAVATLPEPCYTPPQLLKTTVEQGQKRKATPKDAENEVLQSALVVVDAEGEARRGSAQGSQVEPAGDMVAPHKVPQSECTAVPMPVWSEYSLELWRRVGAQAMLDAHLMLQHVVESIEVMSADATVPVVWQARALKPVPPGRLVLVPFSMGPLLPFSDGGKLKRPAALHPALPWHAVVTVGAQEWKDEARFIVKSPLSGKPGSDAPAPLLVCLGGGQRGGRQHGVAGLCIGDKYPYAECGGRDHGQEEAKAGHTSRAVPRVSQRPLPRAG